MGVVERDVRDEVGNGLAPVSGCVRGQEPGTDVGAQPWPRHLDCPAEKVVVLTVAVRSTPRVRVARISDGAGDPAG